VLRGLEDLVLCVAGVVFSRCGGWYPMPRAVQGGAGISRIVRDQVLFCTDVVASVTLASLDGVVRTVTALYKWSRPLCIA
jgi:hypothetical protein